MGVPTSIWYSIQQTGVALAHASPRARVDGNGGSNATKSIPGLVTSIAGNLAVSCQFFKYVGLAVASRSVHCRGIALPAMAATIAPLRYSSDNREGRKCQWHSRHEALGEMHLCERKDNYFERNDQERYSASSCTLRRRPQRPTAKHNMSSYGTQSALSVFVLQGSWKSHRRFLQFLHDSGRSGKVAESLRRQAST